ncbi:MAG: hypothetical protein ACTSRI_09700 [Promethearchaeota archaeon]
MSKNNSFNRKIKSFHEKLTAPKVVKISIWVAMLIFLPGLLIGVIIASLFGPGGYNIVDNYISDLGSIRYTPTPFILDTIAMMTSIIMIPIFFYLKNLLVLAPFNEEDHLKKKRGLLIKLLAFLGLVFGIFGIFGLFGIGLFSEDRSTEFGLHYLFSVVVFGGLAIGALFNGLVIVLKKTIFPKIIGIFMIFGSPGSSILFLIHPPQFTLPFLEWTMLACIFLWFIPIAHFMLKRINFELKNQ